MTNPENFLKSSSELNLVLRSITRSQVLRWAGPAWITASISLHTEVFIRPNEVMTSSCNSIWCEALPGKMMTPFDSSLDQTFHIYQIMIDHSSLAIEQFNYNLANRFRIFVWFNEIYTLRPSSKSVWRAGQSSWRRMQRTAALLEYAGLALSWYSSSRSTAE